MLKNKRFLLTGVLCCFLVLGSQAQAINVNSSIESDETVTFQNKDAIITNDKPNDKAIAQPSEQTAQKTELALTTDSTETDFPSVPITEVTLHEGTIETAKISKNVINWISAPEDIVGIRYDKGVENFVADYEGKNCYLRYAGKKVLVYIMTENAVYPTWLVPADIAAVHIKLKKNNPLSASQNDSPMANSKGQTYSNNKETKLIEIVKYAYGDPTEPVAVAKLKKVNVGAGLEGYRFKSIKFEDGMYVEIYLFKLAPNSLDDELPIKETDFLVPQLCYYPIGVAIEYPDLRKDRFTRVFVIGAEKIAGEGDYELQ